MTQSEILDRIIQDIIEDYQEKPINISVTVAKIREMTAEYWYDYEDGDTAFTNYLQRYYPQYYKELK